ncbi:MAG: hydroxymethylbutenyl pyrophosphate reductase, partial [Clostridia bacterium]|nr:hydroxymethylbutenyl pyrophosphate reductase [Clostridia bacterium]
STGASTPGSAIEEVIINMVNENDDMVLQKDKIDPVNEDGDIDFLQAMEGSIRVIRSGQRVQGTVSAINGTEVQVDLGVKHSGFIPTVEFADDDEPVRMGDEVDAFVVKVNDVEGTILLSKRMSKLLKAV